MLSWWCWSHCLLWRPLGRPTHCSRPPSQASTWINDFAILPENVFSGSQQFHYSTNGLNPVWPDWVIYWTLGKFSKPLATINLSKSLTFLVNFCKVVKIYNFSLLGNLNRHLAFCFWSHCSLHWHSFLKCFSYFRESDRDELKSAAQYFSWLIYPKKIKSKK